MKKTLLSLALVAGAAIAFAEEGLYFHPEFYFDKMSPDGKVLATQAQGTVYFYIGENDQYLEYVASEDAVSEYYAIGVGNCISNTGVIVGSVNDGTCAYWEDGEWYSLPIEEDNKSLNMAQGITPDGSRIVGVVGRSGMSFDTELMIKPVLWERGADGEYGEYIELPYPSEDFCGRTPQYITAIAISDDGKTVVGQIVDWSGFYCYPIIYNQDSEGNWSYKTIAAGILYPTDAYFGEWPGDEPVAPDATQFMTEQEYLDAMAEYETLLAEYYRKANAFEVNLVSVMYNNSFTYNNVYISGNGKYASFTMEWVDMTDIDNLKVMSTPTYFDLAAGKMTQIEGANKMIASSIMNDGRMVIQSPAMAYGRDSYIAAADGKSYTTFYDYMAGYDASIAEWMREFSVFDVITIDGVDEYGDPNYVVIEDSIVSGSVHSNSEGTVFTAFMYDEWSDYTEYRQYSYQINLNELMSVEGVKNDATQAYVSGNMLYLQGDVEQVAIYDLRGAVVYRIDNPHNAVLLDIEAGIYVVAVTGTNGTKTMKVVVK